MGTLNDWLKSLYDGEQEKVAAASLEEQLMKLSPDELLKIATGEKTAGTMSLERRESLPAKSFAVPKKKAERAGTEVKGEAKGAYPIPDRKHARNALARVAQHGTPAEKEMVERKVHARFPDIGKEASLKKQALSSELVEAAADLASAAGRSRAAERLLKKSRNIERGHRFGEKLFHGAGATESGHIAGKRFREAQRQLREQKKKKALETIHRMGQGPKAESVAEKTVTSSARMLSWADDWGRALAQMEKEARWAIPVKPKDTGFYTRFFKGRARAAGMTRRPALSKETEKAVERLGEKEGLEALESAAHSMAAVKKHASLKLAYDIGPTGKAAGFGCKTGDFEKGDEFTSPEAQEKAKVVQQALKATKGAPHHVRKAAVKVTAEKMKQASMRKEAILPGGIAGYLAQGDPEATPRSGFWRGVGGGIIGAPIGGALGGLVGRALGRHHEDQISKMLIGSSIGTLLGNVGGGYLAGRTARATPEELAAHLAKKKALAASGEEPILSIPQV